MCICIHTRIYVTLVQQQQQEKAAHTSAALTYVLVVQYNRYTCIRDYLRVCSCPTSAHFWRPCTGTESTQQLLSRACLTLLAEMYNYMCVMCLRWHQLLFVLITTARSTLMLTYLSRVCGISDSQSSTAVGTALAAGGGAAAVERANIQLDRYCRYFMVVCLL